MKSDYYYNGFWYTSKNQNNEKIDWIVPKLNENEVWNKKNQTFSAEDENMSDE